MIKKLLKTTCTKKLEKVTYLILQKHINPNKHSFQQKGYPDAGKNIHLSTNRKKGKTAKN